MPIRVILPLLLVLIAGVGVYLLQQSEPVKNSGLQGEGDDSSLQQEEGPEQTDMQAAGQNASDAVADPLAAERKAVESTPKATVKDESESEAKVWGLVLDPEGQPIEGAEIRKPEPQHAGIFINLEGPKEALALSDETGRFEVEAKWKEKISFQINAPGFLGKTHAFELAAGSNDLGSVSMERAMILEGRVVDSRGVGIAGAKIIAPQMTASAGFVIREGGGAAATTDEQGRFRMDQLAPGAWRFLIRSAEHRNRIIVGDAPRMGTQSGLLWTLSDGLQLQGRVTGIPPQEERELVARVSFAADDKIAKALDGSVNDFWLTGETTPVFEDGTFRFSGLHPEMTYQVVVTEKDESFNLWIDESDYLTDQKVIPADAGTVNLAWQMRAGLRVRVVDAKTGKALKSFKLASPERTVSNILSNGVASKEDPGLMVVTNLVPTSESFTLIVNATGYEALEVPGVKLSAGRETDVGVVRIQTGFFAEFLVRASGTGEPLKLASVKLIVHQTPTSNDEMAMDPGYFNGGRGTTYSAGTNKEGRVRVQYSPGASWTVEVKHRKFAQTSFEVSDLGPYASSPLLVELTKGGGLQVTVVDAQGNPVPDRMVRCKPNDASGVSTARSVFISGEGLDPEGGKKTNAQGLATFDNLAAGDYTCTLVELTTGSMAISFAFSGDTEAPVSKDPQVTILEGEQSKLTMVAPTKATIEGIVREDGQPLVGAEVVISDASDTSGMSADILLMTGKAKSARTNSKGYYKIENVDTGEGLFTISHANRAMPDSYERDILGGSQTQAFDLLVTIVAGQVVDGKGNPCPGMRIDAEVKNEGGTRVSSRKVSVSSSSGGSMFFGSGTGAQREPVVTDEEGKFRLRGVVAGKPIQLVATGDDYAECRSKRMTLSEGAVREGIVLETQAAGSLQVTLLNRSGEVGPMALLELKPVEQESEEESEEEQGMQQVSGADMQLCGDSGLAIFNGVKPGRYILSVNQYVRLGEGDDPRKPDPMEVVIKEGERTKVEMRP